MSKDVKNWLLALGLTILTVSLPVVPVQQAAVIPDPIYRQVWVSLFQIARFTFNPMPGLQYRLTWYSWIVVILLLGFILFVNRSFSKKLV